MDHTDGDKVLIKRGSHAGVRGIVKKVSRDSCQVQPVGSSTTLTIKSIDILNYSLAARKAWLKMPHRKVGRPPGTRVCDRISVTLRVDRDIWTQFQDAETRGFIEDRTGTINQLLRGFLRKIIHGGQKAS